MAMRVTTSRPSRLAIGRFGAAGLCAATLFGASPAGADDAAAVGGALQYVGAFADLAGQPEVGDILTMAGMLVGATSEDSTGAQIDRINTAISKIQTDMRVLSQHMSDLQNAQNLDALAIARNWNVQTLQDLTEKTDGVRKSVDEVLQPLTRTPAAEIDAVPDSGGGLYTNRFHTAAFGVAASTVGEADSFIDLRYRPYGGGCAASGTSAGVVGDCSPNPLWVVSAVTPQQVADRDEQGKLRSYGTVDGAEMVPTYKFRPEVGLGTYFAELRTAVAAMETDLGGQDMAGAKNTVLLNGKYAYFRTKYAHLFDRHIAFLTYAQAPPDPSPDGAGSTDYYRYVTHTNTSLSDAYYIAMRRGQEGMSPRVWMMIDEMRDLLAYAQIHGTSRGWRYSEPAYIAQYVPPAHTGPSASAGATQRQLSAAAQAAQAAPAGPDDIDTFLIGADAQGRAYSVKLVVKGSAGALTRAASPFWTQPDLSALVSSGESGVIGVTQSYGVFSGAVGGSFAPVSGGPGFALQAPRGLFGGGDGVLYGISANGALIWTRITGAVAAPARAVGSGWAGFRQVVGAGHGVVYALTPTGDLLWYRHEGYLDGSVRWQGPITVAQGWGRYARIAAGAGGVLIGVNPDGSADYYHHRDVLTGVSAETAATQTGPLAWRERPQGAPRRLGSAAASATLRPSESAPRTGAHIAGPIALTGANLGAMQPLSGELDIAISSGAIK